MCANRIGLSSLFLAAVYAAPAAGAEFSTRIVDGLGRPIAGVAVEVSYDEKQGDGKYHSVKLLRLSSDADGRVRGEYDEKAPELDG